MSYRVLPDNDNRNTQSQCNNPSCPTKTIYWNPQVVHSQTGRMTPLNEPFLPQQKAPVLHRCMRSNPPNQYIRKSYGDPILDNCNYFKELGDFLKKIPFTNKTL